MDFRLVMNIRTKNLQHFIVLEVFCTTKEPLIKSGYFCPHSGY